MSLADLTELEGDDALWRCHRVIWREPNSWVPQLTAWLKPRLRSNGWETLSPGEFRDLCWDDSDWLKVLQRSIRADLESVAESLCDALERAVLRVYHGCRPESLDAYIQSGLKRHDQSELRQRLEAIVDGDPSLAWMKPRLEEQISRISNEIDPGRLYVVADDQFMLEHAAHYLIYGSEWISAVLGAAGRRSLLSCGVPTMLEIDLPLTRARPSARLEFAWALLQEWTRLICNQPSWSAPIDFTFMLTDDLPPELIVGHYHPSELPDPLMQFEKYRPQSTRCAHCP